MSVERLKNAVDNYNAKAKELDRSNALGAYLNKYKRRLQGFFGSKVPRALYDADAALKGESYSIFKEKGYGNMGLDTELNEGSGVAGYLFTKLVNKQDRDKVLSPRSGALRFSFLAEENPKKGKNKLAESQIANFYIRISYDEAMFLGGNTVYINVTATGSPLSDLIAYYNYATNYVLQESQKTTQTQAESVNKEEINTVLNPPVDLGWAEVISVNQKGAEIVSVNVKLTNGRTATYDSSTPRNALANTITDLKNKMPSNHRNISIINKLATFANIFADLVKLAEDTNGMDRIEDPDGILCNECAEIIFVGPHDQMTKKRQQQVIRFMRGIEGTLHIERDPQDIKRDSQENFIGISNIEKFNCSCCYETNYDGGHIYKDTPRDLKQATVSMSIFADLIKLSNHFDSLGLTKEADYLDSIIKKSTRLIDQLDPEKFDEEEEIDDNNADDKVNCG
jgi:hypothetical protein